MVRGYGLGVRSNAIDVIDEINEADAVSDINP
jgi:hypothetical protein